mgnify:FL=1
MIGRVTSALTNSNLVFSMQNSYSNYAKLTTQLSSGKKINSMLDDPTQSVNLVNSKRELTRIDTWNNNIKSLKNEIGQATDTLDLLIESGQRAKDLATSVSNNIYNNGSLKAVKDELEQIIGSVVSNANTKYDGKYIFSGTNTQTQPYSIEYAVDNNGNKTDEIVGIKYNGTDKNGDWKRSLEIADGVFQQGNVLGIEALGEYSNGSSEGIMGCLMEFKNTVSDILENKNGANYSDISGLLDKFTTSIDRVARSSSKLGGIINKLDMAQNSLENNSMNLKDKISGLEDLDLTQAITDWYSSQSAYQASMKVFTAFNSMSLLNYM